MRKTVLAALIAYGAGRQRRPRSRFLPGRSDNTDVQSYKGGKDTRSGP